MPVTLAPPDKFVHRHIGPSEEEIPEMLRAIGVSSVDELIDQTIPAAIRLRRPLALPPARTEHELLEQLQAIASKNEVWRTFVGMGYSDCVTPPVIQRNV